MRTTLLCISLGLMSIFFASGCGVVAGQPPVVCPESLDRIDLEARANPRIPKALPAKYRRAIHLVDHALIKYLNKSDLTVTACRYEPKTQSIKWKVIVIPNLPLFRKWEADWNFGHLSLFHGQVGFKIHFRDHKNQNIEKVIPAKAFLWPKARLGPQGEIEHYIVLQLSRIDGVKAKRAVTAYVAYVAH